MAGDLEVGDRILALDGSYGTVEALEVVERVQAMYDLTVAEAHTFAVDADQWVVHNTDAWEYFYRAMSKTELKPDEEAPALACICDVDL